MTGLASRGQLRMSLLRYALVTIPFVLLLGTVSGRIGNAGEGNPWFAALAKPDFMPPGWLFGAAWTILYILLGLALAMLLHARGAHWRDDFAERRDAWLGHLLAERDPGGGLRHHFVPAAHPAEPRGGSRGSSPLPENQQQQS